MLNFNSSLKMIQDDRFELFGNLYAANVKNRFRKIDSPPNNAKKVWESIQNTKDCLKKFSRILKFDINSLIYTKDKTIKHQIKTWNI